MTEAVPRDFGTAKLVQRPRSFASIVGTVFLLCATLSERLPYPALWPYLAALLLLTSLGFYASALVDHHRRGRFRGASGVLRSDGLSLSLGGKTVLPTGAIFSAAAYERLGNWFVVVTQRARFRAAYELALESESAARALVASLDNSTNVHSPRLPGVPRFRAIVTVGKADPRRVLGTLACLALTFGLWRILPNGWLVIWFLSLPFRILPMLLRREVLVGNDGVATADGRTFVPFSALDRVGRESQVISLHRRDGKTVRLQVCESNGDRAADIVAALPLHERIESAFEGWKTGGEPELAPLLARGDRSASEWLAAVRSLGDSAASFRSVALPADTLLRVVEDPKAAPTVRAGAAASLAGHLDEAGAERVRIASEQCASPALRRVLTVAAARENVALEDALGAVEDDGPASRAPSLASSRAAG